MVQRLVLEANIAGVLRTRQRQDVEAATRMVLERVGSDPVFAPWFDSYIYSTLHHYRPRFDPFDWQTVPQALLADMVKEPRAGVSLKGPEPGIHLALHLNCENEILKETVDGNRRHVPKVSERSTASLSASAEYFTDPAFIQAYLDLTGDLFEIIEGEYGRAGHPAIHHGNDFDRVHQDLLEPWFITWANFSGPELVTRLGREQLLSAPAHRVRELSSGSIVLTIAASPLEQLQPAVQERVASAKALLGLLSPSERAAPEDLAAFQARSAAAEAEMKRRVEDSFQKAREKTAAEMLRQAEGCVEGVRQFWGEHLDFSPQSLAVVDRLIRTQFGSRADNETVAVATQAFGAYAGEVVRRTLGGIWHDEEIKGQPVLLNVGDRSVRVEPFRIVSERLDHGCAGKPDLSSWYREIGG